MVFGSLAIFLAVFGTFLVIFGTFWMVFRILEREIVGILLILRWIGECVGHQSRPTVRMHRSPRRVAIKRGVAMSHNTKFSLYICDLFLMVFETVSMVFLSF